MKTRIGFVSNSSSTSFIITNTSEEIKTLVDFVKETPQLIEEFRDRYDWHTKEAGNTQEQMLECAKMENIVFMPKEKKNCIFGDEVGTVLQRCYDYILRSGGKSESFKWHFDEYLR